MGGDRPGDSNLNITVPDCTVKLSIYRLYVYVDDILKVSQYHKIIEPPKEWKGRYLRTKRYTIVTGYYSKLESPSQLTKPPYTKVKLQGS
jgi:hypothetical protein